MVSVTAFTAERLDQLDEDSIVSGGTFGDNLILGRRGGVLVDAGRNRGWRGPAGPIGVEVWTPPKRVMVPKLNLLTIGARLKLPDPAVLPPTNGQKVDWSPDGRFVAIGGSAAPWFHVYAFDGYTLTKIADPTTTPTFTVRSIKWSNSGRYLAVAHDTAPRLSMYSFDGTTLTKLANPGSSINSNATGVAWSPDDKFVALGSAATPYIRVYTFNGANLTLQAAPAVLPPGGDAKVAWHPSGKFLLVGTSTGGSPYLTFYSFNGTTLTKLSDIAASTMSMQDLNWSPDGRFLVTATSSSPYTHLWMFDGIDTLTKLTDPAQTSGAYACEWSPDGRYLLAGGVGDYIRTYKFQSATGEISHPIRPLTLPSGTVLDLSWSRDGRYVAAASQSSPFLLVYDTLCSYFDEGTYTPVWVGSQQILRSS